MRDVYDWDPGTYLRGVPEEAVIGVEGPLRAEHVEHRGHIDFMTFPRLPAIAELGWSPQETHDWQDFRRRLATHGPRWTAQGHRVLPVHPDPLGRLSAVQAFLCLGSCFRH